MHYIIVQIPRAVLSHVCFHKETVPKLLSFSLLLEAAAVSGTFIMVAKEIPCNILVNIFIHPRIHP